MGLVAVLNMIAQLDDVSIKNEVIKISNLLWHSLLLILKLYTSTIQLDWVECTTVAIFNILKFRF